MESIKIEFPSLQDNIRIVESFIDNAKEKYHINDDIYGNIMISVTESVNNAIIHGNKNDRSKNVKIQLSLLDDRVIFRIEDEGNGFNYDSLPDPTAPENLDKPGGRGIYLIKNLCDKISFSDNGRVIEMEFSMK